MILGEICTRRCGFCNVRSGRPEPGVDEREPEHIAEAVGRLGLRHVVVTSVDRDDLPDGGAGHFREVITAIREAVPGCAVEVLTPDFRNKPEAPETVLGARPDVFAHNVETVHRLYRIARPGSSYEHSLELLAKAARYRDERAPGMAVKSSLMLGLGEDDEEIREVLRDLRGAGVGIVTLGQYLQPTKDHLPVDRFVTPAEFERIRRSAMEMGFLHVEAGPLVRSSYHAERHRPVEG
jgi:lipoic acid synthetase